MRCPQCQGYPGGEASSSDDICTCIPIFNPAGEIEALRAEVNMLREANAAAVASEQASRNEANRLRGVVRTLRDFATLVGEWLKEREVKGYMVRDGNESQVVKASKNLKFL